MHRPRSIPPLVVLAALVVVTTALASSAMSASSREQAALTPPAKNGLIAFRRYFDAGNTTGAIFTIQPNGKGERQVTPRLGLVIDNQPDWSPDGSLIVFERNDRPQAIYTVMPDGSQLTRLSPPCTYTGPNVEAHCEDGAEPHFLPDGTGVMYTRVTGKVVNGGLVIQKDIAVRDIDGGNLRTVIRGQSGWDCYEAQLSPDGSKLAYVCDSGRGLGLFVSAPDGTSRKQLTPWRMDAGDDPDWSPDGKLLLFKSYVDTEGKQSQLYVVRPDGTGLKQLTHFKPDTIVTSASFSPDGKWITFGTNGAGGQADVFVMRTNGKGIRAVTHTKLWDSAPDWGPTP